MVFKSLTFSTVASKPNSSIACIVFFSSLSHLLQPVPNILIIMIITPSILLLMASTKVLQAIQSLVYVN